MATRDELLRLLTELRTRSEDAEARATAARDRLAQVSTGLTPLEEVEPDVAEAAADDLAAALREWRLLNGLREQIRELTT